MARCMRRVDRTGCQPGGCEMTSFSEQSAWHLPEMVGSDRKTRRMRATNALEVAAPDDVRLRVEAPGPSLRATGIRPRHTVVSANAQSVPAVTVEAQQVLAKALGNTEPSAETIAQSALDQVVCFTPGTCILTGHGERPIETLQVGDMVVTRDQGLRPIRWIGRRQVAGHDLLAPIRFHTGERGAAQSRLLVSPHHRMLFTGHRAHMLFGSPEVLVAAKDLVNGRDVARHPVEEVTYIHLMFDHHEVIYADGIATESFHAADAALTGLDEAAREAVFATFPELRSNPGRHLVPARACLDEKDARLLADRGLDSGGTYR